MRPNPVRVCLLLSLAACAAVAQAGNRSHDADGDHRDISKVNGGVELPANASAGDISTVNGGIRMGARSRAGEVENVNGGIELDEAVTVAGLSGVNGGITAGADLHVEGDVSTVNGGLQFGPGTEIGGNLSAVNGGIALDHAHIAGKVEFYNGELDTGRESRLDRGITVKKPQGGWNAKRQTPPRIIVGPGSVVSGDIVLERETELFVHQSAKIGRVSGGTPKTYSGDQP
jgi:hypothetical protein